MGISLSDETQRLLEEQVRRSGYRDADELIRAGLASLKVHGDFASGELDALLKQGEADLAAGNFEDGEAFFARLEEESDRRRKGGGR